MVRSKFVHVRTIAVCLVLGVLSLGLSSRAFSQGAACAGNFVTVNNLSACAINICVVQDVNGTGSISCVIVAAGGVGFVPIVPGGTVVGVMNFCCFYPFQPTLVAPPNWWVPNVTFGAGCCVDIMFDETTCTMNVVPTVVPPPTPCRP